MSTEQLSLANVCYEHIVDQYWYGLFGDLKLIIDKNTGYFNATKLCNLAGKKLKEWLKLKSSKSLIQFVNRQINKDSRDCILNIKKGGSIQKKNLIVSGTYLPRQLILGIGLWISDKFYWKIYNIVECYYKKEFEEKYKNDVSKVKEKMKKVESEMRLIRVEYEKIKCVKDDITPKTKNVNKHHSFTLLNKNKVNCKYPYYVIRSQKVNHNAQIKKLKLKFPKMETIYHEKYNPNSINLFNRVKEQIPYIDTNYNHIKLKYNKTEEQFLKDLKSIASSKFK